MKTLWFANAVVVLITMVNLLAFFGFFGRIDFTVVSTLLVSQFLSLGLFLFELDKKMFISSGFSSLSLWIYFETRIDSKVTFLDINASFAIIFLFSLILILATVMVSKIEGLKTFRVFLLEIMHSGLIFGVVWIICILLEASQAMPLPLHSFLVWP